MEAGAASSAASPLVPADAPKSVVASPLRHAADPGGAMPGQEAWGDDGVDRSHSSAERSLWGLASRGQVRRVYEVWPEVGGRSHFCCYGLFFCGPTSGLPHTVFTWFAILFFCAFYLTFCGADLARRVTPGLPILTASLAVSSMCFLLLVSCTDPGIIPRRSLQLAVPGLPDRVAEATGIPNVDPQMMPAEALSPSSDAGESSRWCATCQLQRPPGASHCRVCDNCVLGFDHHCFFVNNCIAQRNFGFFMGFQASLMAFGILVMVGMLLSSMRGPLREDTRRPKSEKADAGQQLLMTLVIAVLAVALFALVCFSAFHVVLVSLGGTTKACCRNCTITGDRSVGWPGSSLVPTRSAVLFERSSLEDTLELAGLSSPTT